MSMAPPAARRKSDAAAERRRQLEEWKKKKEAQRKRQSTGGRSSLGGAASSRPSVSGVSDVSNARRISSGSVAQGTPTSRSHAAREGVQQWDKDRRASAKLAVNDAAARRKKSVSPANTATTRAPSSSSSKKKAARGTPSPPVAVRASAKENTPPEGKALVPSPEAVSAFVASLRSVDVSCHHSPSIKHPRSGTKAPAMAATSWMNATRHSSPPGMSTPRSGVSRVSSRPPIALPEEKDAKEDPGPSPRSVAVAEEKARADAKRSELETQMRRLEAEKEAMRSNLALLGVKMGDLEASATRQREDLERERAAASEAAAALEAAWLEKIAAVEEKEFTIEAQAGMLQQLSSELERAEKCRRRPSGPSRARMTSSRGCNWSSKSAQRNWRRSSTRFTRCNPAATSWAATRSAAASAASPSAAAEGHPSTAADRTSWRTCGRRRASRG